MKRITTLFLALALVLSIMPTALAFDTTRTYTPGQFTDVPANSWCADNVRIVYESGIMNGATATTFGVNGTMSVAQAVVIACRIHADYHQKEIIIHTGASPWYQPYVDYAEENGLWVTSDANYGKKVTRGDFVTILSMAVPDNSLKHINTVDGGAIPDVPANKSYTRHVYRFYRAGIVTGNDKKGTFAPDSTITRGAAAAIISRIIDSSLRKSVTLSYRNTELVALEDLAHYDSLKQSMTDAEFQEVYDFALDIVTPLLGKSKEDQIREIYAKITWTRGVWVQFSLEEEHHDDAYGFFIKHVASQAGITRATGLCLDMLGLPYEHIHENQFTHQWCRIDMGDGTHWICDPDGCFWGEELCPYWHPDYNYE